MHPITSQEKIEYQQRIEAAREADEERWNAEEKDRIDSSDRIDGIIWSIAFVGISLCFLGLGFGMSWLSLVGGLIAGFSMVLMTLFGFFDET